MEVEGLRGAGDVACMVEVLGESAEEVAGVGAVVLLEESDEIQVVGCGLRPGSNGLQ